MGVLAIGLGSAQLELVVAVECEAVAEVSFLFLKKLLYELFFFLVNV